MTTDSILLSLENMFAESDRLLQTIGRPLYDLLESANSSTGSTTLFLLAAALATGTAHIADEHPDWELSDVADILTDLLAALVARNGNPSVGNIFSSLSSGADITP